jgi:hypothetical protein
MTELLTEPLRVSMRGAKFKAQSASASILISVEHDTYFGAKGIFHSSLRTYAAGRVTIALGQTEQSKPEYSPEGAHDEARRPEDRS